MSTLYELYCDRRLAGVKDGQILYFQTLQGLHGTVKFNVEYESDYVEMAVITTPLAHVRMSIVDAEDVEHEEFDCIEYLPYHEDHDVYYYKALDRMEKDIIKSVNK